MIDQIQELATVHGIVITYTYHSLSENFMINIDLVDGNAVCSEYGNLNAGLNWAIAFANKLK